jgi:hypothetical protein
MMPDRNPDHRPGGAHMIRINLAAALLALPLV